MVIIQWCEVPHTDERFAMRYSKGQKQATRQRILEAAGRRFKQDGIEGAGVATLMTDRDLSDQLLARGVATALKLLDDPA